MGGPGEISISNIGLIIVVQNLSTEGRAGLIDIDKSQETSGTDRPMNEIPPPSLPSQGGRPRRPAAAASPPASSSGWEQGGGQPRRRGHDEREVSDRERGLLNTAAPINYSHDMT